MIFTDVIVVGAGNAAFCTALSAREKGASVLMLECAPRHEDGGNSRFTAGAIRFAYDGVKDIRTLCPDLSEEQIAVTDFGAYPTDQFYDDMFRVTRYRTDPALCERLVTTSLETMMWLRDKGVRFMPIYGRQAFKVDGRFKFWGGLTLEFWGRWTGSDRHGDRDRPKTGRGDPLRRTRAVAALRWPCGQRRPRQAGWGYL